MKIQSVCPVCGERFEAEDIWGKVYCSDRCCNRAKKRRYQLKHPEKVAEKNRRGAARRYLGWNYSKKLQHKIRLMTAGVSRGSFHYLIEIAGGVPIGEYQSKIRRKTGDSIDHIVPLSAFNLFEPANLLRAIHHTNVRVVPFSENSQKCDQLPDGVRIENLPFVDTAEAIAAAIRFSAIKPPRPGTKWSNSKIF